MAVTAVNGVTTLLEPKALPSFVETPFIQSIVDRALTYIACGFPIHFRGASGIGKTTLAMHVASKLGRPVVMIHGNEEFSPSDLVGGEHGYRSRKVVDNFIRTVLKTEEDVTRHWVDNRLTVACRYGFTLIYDEYTRSRPETNNVLLPVLQEKMLDIANSRNGDGYLKVHPDFTAIFTSNPEEYAGVYRSPDALRDRMITLDLDQFDEETEINIVQAHSGIEKSYAEKIVRIVRGLRESGACEFPPTIRGCIMVARAIKIHTFAIASGDAQFFHQTCLDILASESSRKGKAAEVSKVKHVLIGLLDQYQ